MNLLVWVTAYERANILRNDIEVVLVTHLFLQDVSQRILNVNDVIAVEQRHVQYDYQTENRRQNNFSVTIKQGTENMTTSVRWISQNTPKNISSS